MTKTEAAAASLRILQNLSRDGPSRKTLRRLLDTLAEALDCERIFLFRLRAGGGFQVLAARNRDRESISHPGERLSHFAVRRMATTCEPLLVQDARRDRRYRPEEALKGKRLPVSILALPLHVQGRLRGGVYADHRFRRLDFPPRLRRNVQVFLHLAELALRLREGRETLLARRKAGSVPVSGVVASRSGAAAAASTAALIDAPPAAYTFHGLRTANPDLLDTFDTLKSLQASTLPVLVYGETGTGKGLLARAVHLASGRRDQQFLVVSCGALPETLVESELLGHVRGAFTGADLAREGLFVQADGGTLFLDEVGDLTVDMQKKLLRVLEEGEVRPLGAKSARRVDVRLICSAGEDLENLVRLGRFRRDLYFRLKGIVLHLAPLRERREDVLPLAEHFLELHTKETGKRRPELSREVKVRLLGHGWPGNVRELENEMRRVVALGKEPLGPGDLKLGPEKGSMALALADGGRTSLDEVVHFAERQAVLAALQRTAGNKSQAASELGITRKALYRRLAKYGIVP